MLKIYNLSTFLACVEWYKNRNNMCAYLLQFHILDSRSGLVVLVVPLVFQAMVLLAPIPDCGIQAPSCGLGVLLLFCDMYQSKHKGMIH